MFEPATEENEPASQPQRQQQAHTVHTSKNNTDARLKKKQNKKTIMMRKQLT